MSESLQLIMQSAPVLISWTLIHSLWLGGLIALFLAGTLYVLRSRSPQLRYVIACAALLLVTPLSVSTMVYLSLSDGPFITTATMAETERADAIFDVEETTPVASGHDSVPASSLDMRTWLQSPTLSLIFMIWLAGVALISVYHLLGWQRARRLVHLRTDILSESWQTRIAGLIQRMDISSTVKVLKSSRLKMPCVVGWIKPTILLPVTAFTGLSVEDLEMIVAHELAHIRRHDVLVNYLQSAIETVLFFNPAVWWISRRIRVEREHCCDDMAAEVCGNRLAYARALTNLEGLRSVRPHLAPAADGTSLLKRVRRLAGTPKNSGRWPGFSLVSVLSLVTLLAFSISGVTALAPIDATAAIDSGSPVNYVEESDDFHGYWEIEQDRRGVFALTLQFRSYGSSTFSLDSEELIGLTEGKDVVFKMVRDAGTFFFEGNVEIDDGEYYGEGDCHFRGDPEYIEQMNKLGYRVGSKRKLFEMALHNVQLDFVRDLRELGYSDMSLDGLLEMHIHRVTPQFIKELAELGYKNIGRDRLVEMRIHNVTPEYIKGLDDAGVGDLSPSELVEMRIHRVDPEYVNEFKDLGMDRISQSRLVEISIHRVTPSFIRALKELGYENLAPSKLVEMRIHNVEPEYIRDLADLGLKDLDPSRLVKMRIHGVEPYFVESLQELGLTDIDPDDLVAMRIHDVTPSFVKKLKEKGYDDLTADDLIEYKIKGTRRGSYYRTDDD